MSTLSLEKRIASAIAASDARSADLATLVADTEAAIAAAGAGAEAERAKALDPALSPDAKAAREAMQAAEFSRDRLRTVLPRLHARHQEIAAAEYLTQWRGDYEALKVKRDALTAELGEIYPKVANQLVDLFTRLKANDAELAGLHRARPSGTGLHLATAELSARNLDGFTRDDPPITKGLQLPDWANAAKMAWPPPQVPLGVLMAQGMVPAAYPAGDWWRPKEEADRAQRERHEREAAEQEAKARENWHGPRWWEGERA
jgi:hypothetical protein